MKYTALHRQLFTWALLTGFAWLIGLPISFALADVQAMPSTSAPVVLSYQELKTLLDHPHTSPGIVQKADKLLRTPFIYKNPEASPPAKLTTPRFEQAVRVAAWNIERGFQADRIIDVFKSNNLDNAPADLREQAEWLSKSQVLLLTEVDNGMNRTQYQDIAQKLASALGMHTVYGVEFLELGPIHLENRMRTLTNEEKKQTKISDYALDPQKYHGMHGSAILSRYPILNVQIIRLPNGYDWYRGEQEKLSVLEKAKRKTADLIFLEHMLTEIRWGGRMALAVDLAIPELPEKRATFVVVHLENRAKPEARKAQMAALLQALKDRRNPVVIGGDWNTTGSDVSPTSVRKEVRNLATNPSFWAKQAISMLAPYGLFINLGLNTTQFTKNLFNPAAADIPLLAPNPEKELFTLIENFRFLDGTCIDTRGDKNKTFNKTGGFMANSNQKWLKGFVPTFSFERAFVKGVIGKYKLDWMMVKGYAKKPVPEESYLFAPHDARTLTGINRIFSTRLSDHDPITVDLPLEKEPSSNSL